MQAEQFRIAEEKWKARQQRRNESTAVLFSAKSYSPNMSMYEAKYGAKSSEIPEGLTFRDVVQANCKHLKGGGRYTVHKDYAVNFHTFANSVPYVRCLICGKTWWPSNNDWQTALEMVHQSTNTPTSSEVRMVYEPKTAKIKVDIDPKLG